MNDLLVQAIVPAMVSLTVIGGGYLANRKLGISSGQKTLVETLQSTVAAQKAQLDAMKVEFTACKDRLEHVEEVNAELKDEVFQLRTDLQKLKRPATRRTRTND